ncbi:hypothetical protein JRQ81_018938 [Phrynocephalus forsythii]|uniref:Aminotransferase class I/classII large domain-containing protein n=1 Tax=Phrynocephalus forsythii TaxID=171643 RepID=A0A9Q0XSU3_9SAUR|nr:hypothetical protein JRQ81_018938 [Phrynocephalus forsythii]
MSCHWIPWPQRVEWGTDELLGVMDKVTIINSTLGKALGGAAGGYTTCPKALVDLLRQCSRPYLFSNSLPPAVVGCASKALDLLMESNVIAQSRAAKTAQFQSKMAAAGFTISGNNHPICPVMLGDAWSSSLIADDMLKKGLLHCLTHQRGSNQKKNLKLKNIC